MIIMGGNSNTALLRVLSKLIKQLTAFKGNFDKWTQQSCRDLCVLFGVVFFAKNICWSNLLTFCRSGKGLGGDCLLAAALC